jgi:tRNA A-37 threonylcarbamoyl transferase component Bud32/Tol biopolymer transport system component
MSLTAGTRLGPYEIVSPLGAGGMGEVYRARDTKLGREAAVKLLLAETAEDPQRRQRFEQEARSASALNHPNIVTIYDIGSADGTTYIAMELVEGRTLRELVAAELLPVRKLLELGVQIADGLARAHAAGIVHRDLKPENVMVTRDGFVKILDFGLAKLTEPVSQEVSVMPTAIASATQPGVVMGTAGYMSPEQASGQPVDFRSDQFTLGAILYELATGKRAFQRKTGAETLVAIIREEPEPIGQLNPSAPPPVRWIVERCLAKDPEDRYASTKDLARDLRSVREHLSETSASAGVVAAQPVRVRRRGWLLPAALAFLAGAAIALVVGRTTEMFGTLPPQFQRLTFRRGAILTARFAPDGNTVVYGAAWEDNPVEIFATRPESPESKSLGFPHANVLAVSRSGELAISLGRHILSGWESSGTLARVPLSGGAPRELLENVQDADWSPDGKELAVTHDPGHRVRLEYPIGKVHYEATGWVSHPRVSPDGRFLAFFDHPERADNAGRLVILDLSRNSRTEGPGISGSAGMAWSPRGQIVLGQGGRLQRVSTSGKVRPLASMPGGFLLEDIAPDGRMLAKRTNYRREIVGFTPGEPRERNLTWLDWSFPDDISESGDVVLFDEQGRGRADYLCYIRKTDGSPAVLLGSARGFALTPDGRWALTTNSDASQLTLLPTGAGSPRPLPRAGLTYQWGTFLPGGNRLLVTATEPGHGNRLYVQDLESARPRAITPDGYTALQNTVSPDGRIAAAQGPGRKIYLCPTAGGAPQPLPGSVADEQPLGWTADGRSLYVAKVAMPARVEIFDIATGKRTLWKELVPPDPAGILAIGPILITPDGKSYVYSYRRTLEDLYLATLKR